MIMWYCELHKTVSFPDYHA